MGPGDQAILVTHQPRWLSDWFWDETACHNLRQLVRGHLRGRARVHLAGQLHALCCHSCAAVSVLSGVGVSPSGVGVSLSTVGVSLSEVGNNLSGVGVNLSGVGVNLSGVAVGSRRKAC